ncbi:MAG: hypothetical protein HYZ57_04685 [Acidobacteria bacterium]|nr:hypothetical protein [Acidobacteriota bacterium]
MPTLENGRHTKAEQEFAHWTGSTAPDCICYSRRVLEQIRADALEGFMAIPRGGIEIGGVLFGMAASSGVTIFAHRPLEIEYLSGPSFQLSPNDEARLRQLLAEAAQDAALQGLRPVGWYHSRTRGGLSLSREDRRIFDTFFPEAGQIALVIKPSQFEPAEVAVFVRDAAGNASGEVPWCSVTLDYVFPGRTGRLASPDPEPGTRTDGPPEQAIVSEPRITLFPATPPARPWWKRLRLARVAALASVLAGIAALVLLATRWIPEPDLGSFGLKVTPNGEQIAISWDRDSSAVKIANSAELRILDGSRPPGPLPLSPDYLRVGSITYLPRSRSVEVRMRLWSRDGRTREEVARFVGPERSPAAPPPPDAVAAKNEEQETNAELQRIRAELARVSAELDRTRSQSSRKVASLPQPPAPSQGRREAPEPQLLAANPQLPSVGPVVQRAAGPPVVAPKLAAPAPPLVSPPHRPDSGRAIWTGRLPRAGLLLIDGRRPSVGALNGRLPQGPARVRVYAADLVESGIVVFSATARPNVVEPPSAKNGWNLTTWSNDPRRAGDISVLEQPNEQNDWKRILIRSENRTLSILVVDWEELPPAAAR